MAFLANSPPETPDVLRMVNGPMCSQRDSLSPYPAWRRMQPELPQVAESCQRGPHLESQKDPSEKKTLRMQDPNRTTGTNLGATGP